MLLLTVGTNFFLGRLMREYLDKVSRPLFLFGFFLVFSSLIRTPQTPIQRHKKSATALIVPYENLPSLDVIMFTLV